MEELINPQNLIFSREQLLFLLPYLAPLLGGMLAIVAAAFAPSEKKNGVAFVLSLFGVLAGLYSSWELCGENPPAIFSQMMVFDSFTQYFNWVFLSITFLVLLTSYGYLEKQRIHHFEYYPLLLFALTGMMVLCSTLDLIVLFLALEMMSVAIYVLVGFRRVDLRSNEAGLKYFILGSAASAAFLFGIALLYGATGSLNIKKLFELVSTNQTLIHHPLLIVGTLFVLFGFLFKVAAAPFHMWMPDVYEGAPLIVTSFMTTAVKVAAFGAFIRVFSAFPNLTAWMGNIQYALIAVAVMTMVIGNLVALSQTNLKRMFAYSSIAHTGYLLLGFLAAGSNTQAFSSVLVYLVAYVCMNLGVFAALGSIAQSGDQHTELKDCSGLGFQSPVVGAWIALFMFSFVGVPPTAGFLGKYLLLNSVVQEGWTWVAVVAVLCSAVSAYYYLRVVVYLYMKEPLSREKVKFGFPATAVVSIAGLLTLQIGFFPDAWIEIARKATQFFT